MDGLFGQVPPDFKLSLKVTDEITVRHFASLSRYGQKAGEINEHFLDAGLFVERFLHPLMPFQKQIGTLFSSSPTSNLLTLIERPLSNA